MIKRKRIKDWLSILEFFKNRLIFLKIVIFHLGGKQYGNVFGRLSREHVYATIRDQTKL